MPAGQQVFTFVAPAAVWTAANEIIAKNHLCIESDTKKMKLGDGVTSWTALAYIAGIAGATLLLAEKAEKKASSK